MFKVEKEMTPMYRVRISCPDCTGQDPYGCFLGGTELIENHCGETEIYASKKEAEKAGEDFIQGTIYNFEVEIVLP